MTWVDQPQANKHVWAFIHYCRRLGDTVRVMKKRDGLMDVTVIRHDT